MTSSKQLLLQQLGQARDHEEHYRDLLILWKRRRQLLERKLIDDPIAEIEKLVEEQFDEEQ